MIDFGCKIGLWAIGCGQEASFMLLMLAIELVVS